MPQYPCGTVDANAAFAWAGEVVFSTVYWVLKSLQFLCQIPSSCSLAWGHQGQAHSLKTATFVAMAFHHLHLNYHHPNCTCLRGKNTVRKKKCNCNLRVNPQPLETAVLWKFHCLWWEAQWSHSGIYDGSHVPNLEQILTLVDKECDNSTPQTQRKSWDHTQWWKHRPNNLKIQVVRQHQWFVLFLFYHNMLSLSWSGWIIVV